MATCRGGEADIYRTKRGCLKERETAREEEESEEEESEEEAREEEKLVRLVWFLVGR